MARWRFTDDYAEHDRQRVIEVETEPTSGLNLTTGDRWEGLHVKARYPMMRDRRWKRANVIGPVGPTDKAAAEAAALRLVKS